jgi:uncharacterized protein YbjT (DUF2867 family)
VPTALLLGATGLVGSELLKLLLSDPRFDRVVAIGRRPCGVTHDRLTDAVVDLHDEGAISAVVKGEALFSCLGTTLRKAGSQAAQREIDVEIPLRVARAAAHSGVAAYGVVSSIGADARSSMFYSRIKGELDLAVQTLGFERVRIVRPSILAGDRAESRPLESLGVGAMKALRFIPGLRRYRPIEARTVAKALLAGWADTTPGTRIYEAEELFTLGG